MTRTRVYYMTRRSSRMFWAGCDAGPPSGRGSTAVGMPAGSGGGATITHGSRTGCDPLRPFIRICAEAEAATALAGEERLRPGEEWGAGRDGRSAGGGDRLPDLFEPGQVVLDELIY